MKRTTPATRRMRWAVATLTGLAVLLPLTACGSASPDPTSPAAFCATFRHQRSNPDQLWNGLGAAPDYSPSMPSKYALEVFGRVVGLLDRLDQEAPAAIKPAMDTLTKTFAEIQADFHHGATVGQVDDYMRQHPPSASGVASAKRSLDHYLTTTCHISG